MQYGCHSMVDPIKSILLKHPADAFLHQAHLEEHWRSFGYLSCPDYPKALREYTFFEECLRQYIPELLYLPVFFRDLLIEMGLRLIEVAWNEYGTLGGNVLTIAPGICLALEGNPVTAQRIRKHGIELVHYCGSEISLMGNGGPTCLTCPIIRRR